MRFYEIGGRRLRTFLSFEGRRWRYMNQEKVVVVLLKETLLPWFCFVGSLAAAAAAGRDDDDDDVLADVSGWPLCTIVHAKDTPSTAPPPPVRGEQCKSEPRHIN